MAKVTVVTDGSTVEGVETAENSVPDFTGMSTLEQLEIFERQRNTAVRLSFEDALKEAVVAEADVDVLNKEKKDSLIGEPFIITNIRVNVGNFGPFVTLTAVTKDDRSVIINDGSTGIAAQMLGLVQKFGTDKNILVKNGLRKSEYYVDKDTGRVVGKEPQPNSFKQATYYLDV